MACCKCCCGNAICEEGDEGKCCCGGEGPDGDCCEEGEFCCDGVCENEPCTPRCGDCITTPSFTVTYQGVAVPAFPFGDIVCSEFNGNLFSNVIVRDARAVCRADGKWEVTARKLHQCVFFPAIDVANVLYDYKWVIEPDPDNNGCPSENIDFTITVTTVDPANLLNTANCNEECWTDDEFLLTVT